MAPSVLDRELYDEALAAEVLGVPRPTLHYWLEGGERRGRTYAPVLRPKGGDKWVVRLDEPITGKFANADLRLSALQLEPMRGT